MAASFAEKAARYRALHAGDVFVAGGCWDAGTARLLAHARLPCLETSSAGVMFALGLPGFFSSGVCLGCRSLRGGSSSRATTRRGET